MAAPHPFEPGADPPGPNPLHAFAPASLPPDRRHSRAGMVSCALGALTWIFGPLTLIGTFCLLTANEPGWALAIGLGGLLAPALLAMTGLSLAAWGLARRRKRRLAFSAAGASINGLNLLGLTVLAFLLIIMGISWRVAQEEDFATDESYGYI